jgi:hypothetical protein
MEACTNEMGVFENQFYKITLSEGNEVRKEIRRRFSDFDMLFEVLWGV